MLYQLRAYWLPIIIAALLIIWLRLEQSPRHSSNAVVLRWVVNSQKRDQLFAQSARTAFETKHPGIRIEFIKQNEGTKVDTMIAGGDAPDVIQIEFGRVYFYKQAGVLRNLAEFMSAEDRKDLSSYFPATLKPFVQDRSVFALPWGYVPFILFYNKNLFDKYQVPYPNDKWKWDDYQSAAKRMTNDLDGDGINDEFGASFATWQEGFYCWMFQNGSQILNSGGTRAQFDSKEVIETVKFLQTLTRMDRVMPTDINTPKSSIGLFEAGKLGMNGPTGSFYIPTYRTYDKIDWDIADVPAGPSGKGTMVTPLAYGVTTQCGHPREAFELVKFLTGEEGQTILADSGLFVPCRKTVALSSRFLTSNEAPKNRYALVSMLDDRNGKIPWGVVPPWSGTRWNDVNDDALNALLKPFLFGIPRQGQTAELVCEQINDKANRILAEDRATLEGSQVNWANLKALGLVALSTIFVFCAWQFKKFGMTSKRAREEQRWGYIAISPWIAGFALLGIGPILFSLMMSMTRWSSLSPVVQSRFIGFQNYGTLLSGRDELFLKSLKATLFYASLSVPLTLVFGLAVALLMNSKIKGIALFRTLYYLPAIMPAVASATLFRALLTQQGIVNRVIGVGGAIPAKQLPDWLQNPSFAIPSVALMSLWAVGGGMMIYLAGLQNIPTQLYEAAKIDGAGVLSQFRNITLPMLSPTLFFNLVMGIIGAFQVFASSFVLFGGTAGPEDAALFYSYYIYRKAFEQFQVGYAAALGWILFVIILALTAIIFRSSPLWVYYESEKNEGRT